MINLLPRHPELDSGSIPACREYDNLELFTLVTQSLAEAKSLLKSYRDSSVASLPLNDDWKVRCKSLHFNLGAINIIIEVRCKKCLA